MRPGLMGPGLRLAAWTTLGIVVTYVVAVRTTTGQYVDNLAMAVLSTGLSDDGWARALLGIVSPATVLLGAVMVTALAWRSRGPLTGLAVAATAAGTVLLSQLLKDVLIRPNLLDDFAANSLPSGHVAAVAGLAVALTLAVPVALRAVVAVLGIVAVATTGLATVVLEWHRPSDVVVAGLIALAMGGLASASAGFHDAMPPKVASSPSH